MTSNGTKTAPNVEGFFKFAEAAEPFDSLQLSAKEQQILDAYDQLETLKVENAILGARNRPKLSRVFIILSNDDASGSLEEQAKRASRELLHAKAAYNLRQVIIENVLITDPCLKAVHSGANASLAERELLPRINRRDILSIAHSNVCTAHSELTAETIAADIESTKISKTNRELTTSLLSLVSDVKPPAKQDITDEDLRNQIEELEAEMKVHRSRWRIVKSVVSGVIVGSGFDWASDKELRELVAEPDDEDF